MTRPTITESATVTLDTQDFRRAVSAAACAAKTCTAFLEYSDPDDGGQVKIVADECIDALAALALGQIRRTP